MAAQTYTFGTVALAQGDNIYPNSGTTPNGVTVPVGPIVLIFDTTSVPVSTTFDLAFQHLYTDPNTQAQSWVDVFSAGGIPGGTYTNRSGQTSGVRRSDLSYWPGGQGRMRIHASTAATVTNVSLTVG